MKKYLLNIFPLGVWKEVYRKIEICGSYTLDDLCYTILDLFDFDNNHLYEFCMNNKKYDDNNYYARPNGEELSTNIILDELALIKGQVFSLHYDFGDDWMFRIRVSKISEALKEDSPILIKAKGYIRNTPWANEE